MAMKVTVECRCGNEQEFALELTPHYTDAELAEQLEHAEMCSACGDIDWSVLAVDDR